MMRRVLVLGMVIVIGGRATDFLLRCLGRIGGGGEEEAGNGECGEGSGEFCVHGRLTS